MATLIDDSGTTRFEGTVTGAVGTLPVAIATGDLAGIAVGESLPDAQFSVDVSGAPNLGGISLNLQSADAGGARVFITDAGTEDGVMSLSTSTGLYVQPRSDASAGRTTVEVTDTSGNDVFVVEADAKIGFYGKAPVAQQTGVAVSDAAIHAALVALGLITA